MAGRFKDDFADLMTVEAKCPGDEVGKLEQCFDTKEQKLKLKVLIDIFIKKDVRQCTPSIS